MAGIFTAIDIGASSGRVTLGRITEGGAELEIVHRFPNSARFIGGALRWDIDALFAEVICGLTTATATATATGDTVTSIGIDTWAVDYGLVDDAGNLLHLPFSYRAGRTETAVPAVHAIVPPEVLYQTTGLQFLPFNTLYQLTAERSLAEVQALLIPDLLAYWLTGERVSEATNASTTGLLDAATGIWAGHLFEALGLPADLFPPLVEPGATIGRLLPAIAGVTGLPESTIVVAVGSHDTASAVAAVPAGTSNFAYISSGTWSLVGIELEHPILTAESRAANFTNERGVDGIIRYLRNTGGLWLLQECLREWAANGQEPDLTGLLGAAAALPVGGPIIDADSNAFLAPDGMPCRILRAVEAANQEAPSTREGLVRCIMDSLAMAYARTLRDAARLSGKCFDVIHVVGGGSQNALLCQLTANEMGIPVLAGPVEATALGNILVQARASGTLDGIGLEGLRSAARRSARTVRYEPANGVATSPCLD